MEKELNKTNNPKTKEKKVNKVQELDATTKKMFECIGDHCGRIILYSLPECQEKLWQQVTCKGCGRKYIMAYNEEEETKTKGYYLEPVFSY